MLRVSDTLRQTGVTVCLSVSLSLSLSLEFPHPPMIPDLAARFARRPHLAARFARHPHLAAVRRQTIHTSQPERRALCNLDVRAMSRGWSLVFVRSGSPACDAHTLSSHPERRALCYFDVRGVNRECVCYE